MKKLIVIMVAVLAACTNGPENHLKEKKEASVPGNNKAVVPLNNGSKWKADEATMRNVHALLEIVDNDVYEDAAKRSELVTNVQNRIDTMIRECTMKGPAHDALHKWLEVILHDVQQLKDNKAAYGEAYERLRVDVQSFHVFFE